MVGVPRKCEAGITPKCEVGSGANVFPGNAKKKVKMKGYKKVRASKLAREQHELLRDAFRRYLTDELIRYIRAFS